jgi:hypothetical protein
MHRRSAGAAVAAAASAVLLMTTAASAATAYVNVTDTTLLAKGAAVGVTASYKCPVGQTGGIQVTLRQVGSRHVVTFGVGATQVVACTGTRQTATFDVTVEEGLAPFKRGDAASISELLTCRPYPSDVCTHIISDQVVFFHK